MTPKLTFVSGQVRALRFPLIQPRLAFKTTRHVACGCRHLRPKVPPKPPDMFHHVSGYSTSSIEKRFHLHPSLVLLTSLAILVWDRSCSPTPSTPKSVKATIQDETTKGCQRPCLKSPKKRENRSVKRKVGHPNPTKKIKEVPQVSQQSAALLLLPLADALYSPKS